MFQKAEEIRLRGFPLSSSLFGARDSLLSRDRKHNASLHQLEHELV